MECGAWLAGSGRGNTDDDGEDDEDIDGEDQWREVGGSHGKCQKYEVQLPKCEELVSELAGWSRGSLLQGLL